MLGIPKDQMIQYRDQAIAALNAVMVSGASYEIIREGSKKDIGGDRERKAALDTHVYARAAAAAVGYDGVAQEIK